MTELGFAHVTTKNYGYLEMFGCSRFFLVINNAPPPQPNPILKIQWQTYFLTFLNADQNAPKKDLE